MISMRKLAAVDMLLHGARLIIAEFAVGVLFPLLLAFFSLRDIRSVLDAVFALWLVGVAVNYVPLLIYAIVIARAGTVETEGRPEIERIRQYNRQQFVLLAPFYGAVLAVMQELQQRKG